MDRSHTQKAIENGKTILGIEFGSTRIKSLLIGEDYTPLATGSHDWENRYEKWCLDLHSRQVKAGRSSSRCGRVTWPSLMKLPIPSWKRISNTLPTSGTALLKKIWSRSTSDIESDD